MTHLTHHLGFIRVLSPFLWVILPKSDDPKHDPTMTPNLFFYLTCKKVLICVKQSFTVLNMGYPI
jgi:hypothetical protein